MRVVDDGVAPEENQGAESMSEDEQLGIEDLLGNIKVPINYSNEQNL